MKICPSCKSDYEGGEIFCPNDGARLVTPSQVSIPPPGPSKDPLIGTILAGRYRVIEQIGEGGMGLVYEVEHVAIEKRLALKVLRDDFSGRPEVVERFKQEAKSATKIGNDHIVDISDFGETPGGAAYFVMELLEGEDLANVLSRDGVVPIRRAASIIEQCCRALGAAHAKGIVHRDMKPENIFLTHRDGYDDFVKIVDFGIAKMSDIETTGAPGRKLTKTGMIFGTPEYMSPEQSAGKPLDHRVDVYALAVILYEMLAGRVPFVGDTFMGILTQHMFEEPQPIHSVNPHAEVTDAMEAFIMKGLAKDPDDRFQSCDEMSAALKAALDGRAPAGVPTRLGFGAAVSSAPGRAPSGALPAAPTLPMTAEPKRRGTGLFVALAAVLLVAVGGGVGTFVLLSPTASGEGETMTATVGSEARGGDETIPEIGAEADSTGGALVVDDEEEVQPDDVALDPEPAGDEAPELVTVRVETQPSGARVWVVDQGEVCGPTPCTFETPAGEEITVRARRGSHEAQASMTPTTDTTTQLPLRRRSTGRPSRPASDEQPAGGREPRGTQQGGSSSSSSGDLKIPDIFRRSN